MMDVLAMAGTSREKLDRKPIGTCDYCGAVAIKRPAKGEWAGVPLCNACYMQIYRTGGIERTSSRKIDEGLHGFILYLHEKRHWTARRIAQELQHTHGVTVALSVIRKHIRGELGGENNTRRFR